MSTSATKRKNGHASNPAHSPSQDSSEGKRVTWGGRLAFQFLLVTGGLLCLLLYTLQTTGPLASTLQEVKVSSARTAHERQREAEKLQRQQQQQQQPPKPKTAKRSPEEGSAPSSSGEEKEDESNQQPQLLQLDEQHQPELPAAEPNKKYGTVREMVVIPYRPGFPFNNRSLQTARKSVKGFNTDEILTWAVKHFPNSLVDFTSFGPSGLVIVDRLHKLGYLPKVPIVTIDTLHLFPESYAFLEEVTKAYPLRVEVFRPEGFDKGQEKLFDEKYGADLWKTNFEQYTTFTKVNPTLRALEKLHPQAWITGRRKSQGADRSRLQVLELEGTRLKINPLADWTKEEVWTYIRENKVPYNPLYDQGYASLGDHMNTRKVLAGESERAGRFVLSGSNTTECGMHSLEEKAAKAKELNGRSRDRSKGRKQDRRSPELLCEKCEDVDESSFQALVLDAKNDFILEFFSPLCGHCQAFAPRYDELATSLAESGTVKALRMDVFHHKVPKEAGAAGFTFSGVPSIFRGRHDANTGKLEVTVYKGNRAKEDLLKFALGQKS